MQIQFITRLYLYFVGVKKKVFFFFLKMFWEKILYPSRLHLFDQNPEKKYYKLKITVFC